MKVPWFGPDEHGPGVEDATSGAPEGGVPRKARGTARCQTEMVRHSALRSLTHVRGKGNEGGPHADQTAGVTNHVCFLVEILRASAGCLTCESEMSAPLVPRRPPPGWVTPSKR